MLRNLYSPDLYRFGELPPSYWETTAARPDFPRLAADHATEVAIIGGGYFGLSAALHLARDFHIDATVLEAGAIGWGASGRNGGFNMVGATKLSVPEMVARYGEAETRGFYRAQVEGQELVTALAADEGFDIQRQGDGVYLVAHSAKAAAGLAAEAEDLRRVAGLRCDHLSAAAFAETAHTGTEQYGALRFWPGYGLNPLRFALGLAEAARRRGAALFAHSPVIGWERDGNVHLLHTSGGTVRARHVVVALNGYLPDGLHPMLDGRVLPVISNIIVTRRMSSAELAAQRFATESPLYNTRNMLFYYRKLADDRILLGGRGDLTGQATDGARMRAELTRRFGELFPAWRDVEIEYFWRGCIAVTRKLAPSVGRLEDDPTIWVGFGCHGNGVNTAPWMGRAVARGIAGVPEGLPAVYRALPPRLPPFGWLRRLGLRLAYLCYSWVDRRS